MPSDPPDLIRLLQTGEHDREHFDCGVEVLNAYLRKRAHREMKASASVCYVISPRNEPGRIAGFYTLSAATVELGKLPKEVAKKLPRYDELGAVLIGRLASDLSFRGKGIGGMLLMSALMRAYRHSREIGAVAVLVDAKDENATRFYEHHGFRPLDGRRLYLPMKDVPKWNPLAEDR